MAIATSRATLRQEIERVLNAHDLHLHRMAWQQDFEKETVDVTIKAGGSANEQIDLPFDEEE